MNISDISAAAEKCRLQKQLPRIGDCVAVSADGSFNSVHSWDQLRGELERGSRICSGLSCYDLANRSQQVLAAFFVNLDLFRRRCLNGNIKRASAAALQVGAIYGQWQGSKEGVDPRRKQLLEVQTFGSLEGAAAMKRKAAVGRQVIFQLTSEIWDQHPRLIGKYLHTATIVFRRWDSHAPATKRLKIRTIRRIISAEHREGGLADFWPRPV